MKSNRLPQEIFQRYGNLVREFLKDKSELKDRLPDNYSKRNIADTVSRRMRHQPDRKLLVHVLNEQYKGSKIQVSEDAVLKGQLQRLESENTFTVTTGHQLCLFTGPLYFIIKIMQAIKMADQLNELADGNHYVPVFWLASEDHDFEEINHTHLFGKTLQWNDRQGGKAGAYSTETMAGILEEVKTLLGDSAEARELKDLFDGAYHAGMNLADGTRWMLHQLFGHRGLVVLDGDHKDLKMAFAELMCRELEEKVLHREVSTTNALLEKSYSIQVNPREVNLFYLAPNSRERIDFIDNKFKLESGKEWDLDTILSEVQQHPERFSPNVIFRPVYEELILPNLVYIGGPGEVAYWMQLKQAFAAFNVFLPLVNLRNNLLWLDHNKLKKLSKLGLEIEDLFLPEPDITKKLIRYDEFSEEIDGEIATLNGAVSTIADKVASIDASVKASVLAEGRHIEKSVEQIIKRFIKAKKDKNEEAVSAYWNLHEKLFPNGSLHERYDNFVPWYLKHGKSFFDVLYDAIDPEDPRLIAFTEND